MRSSTFRCLTPESSYSTTLPRAASAGSKWQKAQSKLNGTGLKQGDGAATDAQRLVIKATEASEVLLFDLA